MNVILIAVLNLMLQTFNETQPWSDYQSRAGSAYALEVRWTKTEVAASNIYTGQSPPKARRFRLLFRKPDFLLLEELGVARTTWIGVEGIYLDLRQKSWCKASTRPEFRKARFLALPWLPSTFSGENLAAKVLQFQSKQTRWNTVHFQSHFIDAGTIFDYTFNDRTKLIGLVQVENRGLMKWTGTIEYRIQSFETDKMLLATDFSINPPTGFTEGTVRECSDSNPRRQPG